MTRVEELREKSARLRAELLFEMKRGDTALFATGSNIRMMVDVDEVLNAFHAEGVAEGVEQMRQKIRNSMVPYNPNGWDESVFIIPAAVLAPTKERGK